jgi:hypothetical protein
MIDYLYVLVVVNDSKHKHRCIIKLCGGEEECRRKHGELITVQAPFKNDETSH